LTAFNVKTLLLQATSQNVKLGIAKRPTSLLRKGRIHGKDCCGFGLDAFGGLVAFYVTMLSLGKPGANEITRNFRLSMTVALLVFLVPGALVWLLDKFVNQEAWKVGLLVFVALALCVAIRVSLG
jgi:hypothetical protein